VRVTLIGDSVAAGIPGDQVALATLRSGIDLQLQVAPCRSVAGTSCPIGGVSPPTVVDIAHSLGAQLGPTVIVEAGYDDFAAGFAAEVGQALQAFQSAGVTHVIWLTLHQSTQQAQYGGMNDTLRAIAATDPTLTLADWNAVSQGQDAWFQADGVHLYGAGARAMAVLLHSTLRGLGIGAAPLIVTTKAIGKARLHESYAVTLTATGGSGVYRWSCSPQLPRGLHLLARGRLTGAATGRPRVARIRFTVTDASGMKAARTFVLRIGS
jgi:Putative Ig domain